MTQDHKALWKECLNKIRQHVTADAFQTWFAPTESISFDGKTVTIAVPSELFVNNFDYRFYDTVHDAMRQVYGEGIKIAYSYYIVQNEPEALVTVESATPSATIGDNPQAPSPAPAKKKQGVVYQEVDSMLKSVYNFENYCVGESNKLPYIIAENLGNNPAKTAFNPFFLYGSTGVGKTHLIQAIGIRIKEKYPAAKVLYITSRIFENQYGTAVKDKRINDFVNFYQGIDVLLIDDIQELANKAGIQNAFYPIFNFLHQKGKLLIMTSDRPPIELDGMMDRLISRFKWGVNEVLPPPDIELRKKILRHKSAKNGLALPDDVIDVIASHVTDSVRELEGVVMSLITRATLLNQTITADLARVVMQSTVKVTKRKINFDMIVDTTAAQCGIDPDVIFSRSKMRDISDARQIIMYLAHKHLGLSSKSIGAKLSRTHVTVLHGIREITDRLTTMPSLVNDIAAIEKSLLSD